MSFPVSPVNGQVYNKLKYNSSTLGWEMDRSITNTINCGKDLFKGPLIRLNFYRYMSADQGSLQYVHFKTNYSMATDTSFCIKFSGYEYGGMKPVKASLVGRINAGTVYQIGSYGSQTCSSYKSADGFLVLTIYVASIYFLGISLDQVSVDPQRAMIPMNISISSYSSSSTGVY